MHFYFLFFHLFVDLSLSFSSRFTVIAFLIPVSFMDFLIKILCLSFPLSPLHDNIFNLPGSKTYSSGKKVYVPARLASFSIAH